jgi:DNA adenine methylase
VQVENNSAIKVINRCDDKETFIYADPPYIGSDQGHYKGYSEDDYRELLDALSKVKGKVPVEFISFQNPALLTSRSIKWKVQKVNRRAWQ